MQFLTFETFFYNLPNKSTLIKLCFKLSPDAQPQGLPATKNFTKLVADYQYTAGTIYTSIGYVCSSSLKELLASEACLREKTCIPYIP